MLQKSPSKRNHRLRGEPHFTPRLMFVQPGTVYERSPNWRRWFWLHLLYLWLDKVFPHGKLYAEEFGPVLYPPLSYLSAPSNVCLTLICPARITRSEEVRGLLISHIIISFHSLWHRVRTEEKHGEF